MADPEPRMPRSSEKTTPKLKYTSFVEGISDADGEKSENLSLQEAFRIYREAKQDEIRKDRLIRKRRELRKANPQQMAALRQKFVDQAKKYYGYPYARKYWPPDSPEYKSKLFLDCCGLVRQVMKDLAEDFGFIIGPWNQAYMFDTLPINVEHEREMKPGDLVFVSATYNNPKSRKQRHNMTHVEIWAGEGKKTIGSRWNNGKVQLWDSYKFNAKSYHSELYHFKSIDTWLTGVCKSYCKEHRWKKYKYCPKKKSIFALPDQQQDAAGNDELKRSKTFSEEISGVSRMVAQCKRELRERPKTDMGIAASKSADCIINDDQAYMDKDQFPAITNDLREFPQQLSPSRAKRNQKSKTSEFRNSGNSCLGKIENTEKMNKEMGSIGLLDDDSRRNLKSSPKTPIKSWSDPTMHGVRSDSVQKSLSQYDDIDEDDDDDEYDAQQGSDDDLYMEDEVTDEEQEQEETVVEVEKVTEVEKSTTEKGEKSTTGGVGKQTKDNVETVTKGDVQLSKNDLGSNNNGNETVDSFGTDLGAIILSKNSNSGASKGADKTAKSKADNGAKFMARGRSLNVGNFLENQRMLIKQGCVCGTDKDKGKEGPKAGSSGVKGGNGNGAVESPSTKKEDTKPVLIKRQLSDLRKKSITETTKTVAFAPVRGTNRNGNSNMSAVGKIGQGQGPDKVAGALGLSPRIKQTAHTQVPSKGPPRILTWDSESGRSNEGGESKKMAEERKVVIAKFPQGSDVE